MSIKVINPATKAIYQTVEETELSVLDDIIADANIAFDTWRRTTQDARQKALYRIADTLEAHAAELADIIVSEQGKPLFLAQAEVGGAIGWTRYAADLDLEPEILEDSDVRRVEIQRLPVGVVASITPWNWPLMIAIWHIMPALKVGCSVVIKPSTLTPVNTLRLAEIINECTIPNLVQVVIGGREIGEPLVQHKGVKKLVFTGSTGVGKHLARLTLPDLKKVTLELGGNDAGIVLASANVDDIAEKIFMTSFLNMGQTCACLKRLYVHRSNYEALSNALAKIAAAQVVGNGQDEGVTFGPVQNEKQFQSVINMIEQAKAAGAEVIAPALPEGLNGYFIAPTLIKNPLHELSVVCDEQFGPVLPIIPYDDLEEVLGLADHEEFALGGSVWGAPSEELERAVERLNSGTVWVNNHAEVLPHIPFGGNKQSGMGVEFGKEGLLEYTIRKVVNRSKR